jgi:hypothetical protein
MSYHTLALTDSGGKAVIQPLNVYEPVVIKMASTASYTIAIIIIIIASTAS